MKLQKSFIPSNELGIALEIVTAKPRGAGPHPTVVFHHGSTGNGRNKSLYTRTVAPAVMANYFVERGWMALFPQRRGRGKCGGAYGEGLDADGSGYSCNVEIAIAGFERAVEDVDAVVDHLHGRTDVDNEKLVVGGVSRGGILAIAYAGMRPNTFRGSINFSGGWLGKGCPSHETVNPFCSNEDHPRASQQCGYKAAMISTTRSRIAEGILRRLHLRAAAERSLQHPWVTH